MTARLEFLGNYVEIRNFDYCAEEEQWGNPYNCSFDIRVVSDGFSGGADGCEYDYKEWKKFLSQLESLYCFESREAILSEICYGSTVKFTMDSSGHIEVSGLVYGNTMAQSLKFCFGADQTVLEPFIMELKAFSFLNEGNTL